MKIIALAASALVATLAVAAPASAQRRVVTTHVETHTTTHVGPAIGHRTRKVCTVSYRRHQKMRTCRTVRY